MDDLIELCEERAAIMQFDGKVSRILAEERAVINVAMSATDSQAEGLVLAKKLKQEWKKRGM